MLEYLIYKPSRLLEGVEAHARTGSQESAVLALRHRIYLRLDGLHPAPHPHLRGRRREQLLFQPQRQVAVVLANNMFRLALSTAQSCKMIDGMG